MKKRIVLPLIILGISLPLCIYLYMSILREFKIDDKDSKLVKKYKLIYNNDLRLLNKTKQQKEIISCYEEEAKKSKKDSLGVIILRVLFNNLQYEKSKDNKNYIKVLEKAYGKKILDTKEEKKKRKILKVTIEDLYEEKELRKKSLELCKEDKINEFASEYNKIFEENEKFILNNPNMTGEEFLKINYKQKWINSLKKQTKTLKSMKDRINKLSKEEKDIEKDLKSKKIDLGVQLKPIINDFEKAPFNVKFKNEKSLNGIKKYIGEFKDKKGIILELQGNEVLTEVTLKIPQALIIGYEYPKYIEDIAFKLISKIFKNGKIATEELLYLISCRGGNAYVNIEDKKICFYHDEKYDPYNIENNIYEFKIKLRDKEELDENEFEMYKIKKDKFLNFEEALKCNHSNE